MSRRWSSEKSFDWYQSKPWMCGFNFLPSSAVNFLEMWHSDTFDKTRIKRELSWATDIGFNTCRVNLHYLVWLNDREGLLKRLDWFIAIAFERGLSTVLTLFDDCGFCGAEPVYGAQPDPVPGVHNSRAVASPGRLAIMDKQQWGDFERYVRDIVARYRCDHRILFWDLYNEPGNQMVFGQDAQTALNPEQAQCSLELMVECFRWARDEKPDQPLTVAAWSTPLPGTGEDPYNTVIDRTALSLSDIITFHAYANNARLCNLVSHLQSFNRPLCCTEWMARSIGGSIDEQLELFSDRGIGCYQWGLVQGRTQTTVPWPEMLVRAHGGDPTADIWFHDILWADGTPYRQSEIDKISLLTGGESR